MTPHTTTLDFERTLALPPSRLWEVLTDPKHREKWGAPEPGMILEVDAADVRIGGQDRHRCGPKDAPEFIVDTRWYWLDGPTSATFTETLIIGGETLATSLVTYALGPSGSGTHLGVTVAIASFSGEDTLGGFGQGWEGGLENLEKYTSELKANA